MPLAPVQYWPGVSRPAVNRQTLPAVSKRSRPVRAILRRFKSRILLRDEFMEQIEILPDDRLNLSDVVSSQATEDAFSGRDEVQEGLVHLGWHDLVGHVETVAWR